MLPKWPACRVEGEPVDEKLAAEIIFRCTNYVSSNDEAFDAFVAKTFGISLEPYGSWNRESRAKWAEKVGSVFSESSYFELGSRIASCYIGGPHGWMSWGGKVDLWKNIGKWPSVEEVQQELSTIAAAWPVLDFKVTLFDGECCEEHLNPVISWRILGGVALETKEHLEVGYSRDLQFLDRNEQGISRVDLETKYRRFEASLKEVA